MPIAPELIAQAAAFLEGRIRRTPMEHSEKLSKRAGVDVRLKLESAQLTGSFKIRGALFRLSRLTPEEKRDGVATCSAGNHGKAVAYAAREFDVRATICVPRSVDRAKLASMIACGADVRVSEFDGYDDTETWAQEIAAREHRKFISAFDDDDIMAANGGTLALEVFEDAPAARAFIVPIGGGGLSAGFACAAKARFADTTIIGCQHELSPGFSKSMEAGRAVTKLPTIETMAAGVEGGIGALTFAELGPRVDRIALVSEDEILEAVRWMVEHHQYLIEPTAGVALAACLTGKIGKLSEPAVVVITGRNVSAESVRKILCRF